MQGVFVQAASSDTSVVLQQVPDHGPECTVEWVDETTGDLVLAATYTQDNCYDTV